VQENAEKIRKEYCADEGLLIWWLDESWRLGREEHELNEGPEHEADK
jgi:hypothetical protein